MQKSGPQYTRVFAFASDLCTMDRRGKEKFSLSQLLRSGVVNARGLNGLMRWHATRR